jgi:hypothetical protein
MTITIDLPSEVEAALQKKAAADGKNIQTYIFETLKNQALKSSLDEILAPIRKNFADSGMTEEELDELIEREREAMWQEKNGKRG